MTRRPEAKRQTNAQEPPAPRRSLWLLTSLLTLTRSHSLFWISSSFQKINKNILEALRVFFLVSFGSADSALSFPTIGKNVRGGPCGPGAAIGGVGGERWGREGEGGEEEEPQPRRLDSGAWGDGFKK